MGIANANHLPVTKGTSGARAVDLMRRLVKGISHEDDGRIIYGKHPLAGRVERKIHQGLCI